MIWLGVALLGGSAAVLRVLLGRALNRDFPYGTLAVNLVGALAIGVLSGTAAGSGAMRLAATGFLGALTTFSAWMWEARRLGRRAGAAYVLLSLALGLALASAGRELGERL